MGLKICIVKRSREHSVLLKQTKDEQKLIMIPRCVQEVFTRKEGREGKGPRAKANLVLSM